MDEGESQRKRKRAEEERTKGASASWLISSVPTGQADVQYDVFLSFRGSDTRNGFTDFLYHGLIDEGTVPIWVFRDDHSISIGEEFSSQIFNAIARSKISIPIISENYASSKWCLRELFRIMDRKKSKSHIVLPIFYKVNPTDVRHLEGKFGEAFHSSKKYFDEMDIQEGQRALLEVSYLNGWVSEKIANGSERELMKTVIKSVLNKLRPDFRLDVPEYLVGICDHVMKIRKWIDTPASEARMIGIHGMGGIGKTTLAKVIYNELSNDFENRSFLPDIREKAHGNKIHYLQNQLINEILQNKHQVQTYDAGINLIKFRFKGKKVLILLDDIDHRDQLKGLARERSWFTPGSVIIVTTENKAILDQSEFGVDYEHKVNKLDKWDSLLLFNRHAFRKKCSHMNFESISRDIVSTTDGHPLALMAIGSDLYRKRNLKVWQDVQTKLEREPHEDVQKILMISYGALRDEWKEIFLDIACFLIGEVSEFAIYMWKDCELYASEGIEELKSRCLIEIDEDGQLRMHGQLRDFGRNIVRKEGPLETRSRLWLYKDAIKVLMGGKGPYTIKAICLDKSDDHLQTYTNTQFESLQSLSFLKLSRAVLNGDFNGLFSELKWFHWFGIEPDLPFLANNLHLAKLVVLQLSSDKITELWGGWDSIKVAKQLKVLNLSCCKLRRTPNLSAFTELEILILKHCHGLEQVDPSIGEVKSLLSLDLSYCTSLKELPRELDELVELKELILDFAGLTKIPRSIGSMRKLKKLSARDCRSLREIPSEIGDLSSLKILEISSAPLSDLPGSISCLSCLQHLTLQDCHKLQLLPKLPSHLTHLMVSRHCPRWPQVSCLIPQEELGLERYDLLERIPELPSRSLEELGVERCDLLEHVPELPSRSLKLCVVSCHELILPMLNIFEYLEELSIECCSSIERLDISQLNRLKRLRAKYCYNLVEIQGHDYFEFLEEIVIYHCRSIKKFILPELQCLKQLKAYSCNNLVEIQGLDQAEFLETLHISDCGSIVKLPELSCFATLTELNINGCGNLHGIETLERFLSCRSMYITGCKSLEKLPNLSKFKNLEKFTMRYSLGVTEIPGIEESRSLTFIDITGCESMKTLPDLSGCHKLLYLVVRDCKKLTQIGGLEKLDLICLDISGCDSLEVPRLLGTSVLKQCEGSQYYEKINLCNMIMLR